MKVKKLKKGDTIALISLSSGLLGEESVKEQVEIGEARLRDYGFKVKYMPNSLRGLEYLDKHPEKRAEDFIEAFKDKEVKAIICAIGGNDTYRISPYLFEDDKFSKLVANNPKIFLGFSDTTLNHFMLHKLGLNSFYGQAFIPDIAEVDHSMLPYSKKYFEDLFLKGELKEVEASEIWYEERKDFSSKAIGSSRIAHEDQKGFELLNGSGKFRGRLLGGCIESIYSMLESEDESRLVEKYNIFPSLDDWKGRILLLETSEGQTEPYKLRLMLESLKKKGIFDLIEGVIIGKPMDEVYYDEYKEVYTSVIDREDLPIVYNINIGHATPRAILPFGVELEVDADNNRIKILEDILF